MKKNLLLLVLALIGMGGFTACNNEDELLVQEQTETKPVVIRATIGNVSRLALGNSDGTSTKVSWSEGDAFALKIGDKSYTFEWQEGNDFVYDNNNGDFPATFADAGTITATYPATITDEFSVQSGTKANVGNYMQMAAELDVNAGDATDDLNLKFEHQTSVVEIALEKSELAGKSVVVDLRTITASKYSTPAEEGVLSFDSNGKLTVYFAVSPIGEVVKEWYVGVKDIAGNEYYTATLSDLQLAASKMYKVSKTGEALKNTSYLVSTDGKTFIAYDADGLYKWAEMVSQNTTSNIINLELGADITLPTEGITLTDGLPDKGNWTPLVDSADEYKVYRGTIDGKNHTIKNMYIVYKENWPTCAGFIDRFDGNIKNLKFDNAKIVGNPPASSVGYYIGVVSGISYGIIDNCHVTNSTVKCLAKGSNSQMVGGLVGLLNAGSNAGKITNSSFNGTIDGRSRVGGIVGELIASIGFYNYIASVTNCTAEGTIEGNDLVGGIAGWSRGYIEECTNEATVKGADSGGIVGQMAAYACTIGCTNYGEITGETYASYTYGTGGIVGLIKADDVGNDTKTYVIACRNLTDKVTLTGDRNSGGVVGYIDRALSGVYGSYTVKSDVANAFTACVAYNPNSATNDRNKVFESATDDDLTSTGAGVMSLGIENAFTAMDTAPKSPYVSSGNYNTYKDYCWTFLALDSWPVFFKKAGLSSVP